MNRRNFLTTMAIFSAVPTLSTVGNAEENGDSPREYIQMATFFTPDETACRKLVERLDTILIPALNQQGFAKVGVLSLRHDLHANDSQFPEKYRHAVLVVFSSPTFDKLENLHEQLHATDFPAEPILPDLDRPLYDDQQNTLLRAFPGCPTLEVPTLSPQRVLQLRCYASPNANRNRSKRDMFDVRGELSLFRRCGMAPVFFGETLLGGMMAPSLHYMLSFENDDARRAGWQKFVSSDEWKKMRDEPEFHHTATRIINLFLKPSPHSQI
ncbi:MAG: NIPSNAP family protein [Planctomycetia bacterium]|nr:NIPSNAP family protein [Planctomycetia bacterium]